MPNTSPEAIIDSVVEFTVNSELHSLAQSLIKTITQLTPSETVFLFSSHPSYDGHKLITEASNKTPEQQRTLNVEFQRIALRCIEQRDSFRLETADNVTEVLPIFENGEVSHVLMIRGHEINDENLHLLRGLSKIYENFLHIISEGERDGLTGLLNRKVFHNNINTIITLCNDDSLPVQLHDKERRHKNTNSSYWLAAIDIDHFKRINDNHGHLYGDEVIITITKLMQQSFRKHDLLFRYGGEEFIAIVGPTSNSQAFQAFNRFRQHVEEHNFNRAGQVTVSMGVVNIKSDDNPTIVMGKADRALYYSKDNGRNKMSIYEELIANKKINKLNIDDDIELF